MDPESPYESLAAALEPAEVAEEVSQDNVSATDASSAEPDTQETTETSTQSPDAVINDPRVQQAIENARRAGQYEVQRQLQEQAQQNVIQSLPDDEYGRYVRQQQQYEAQMAQVQNQIAAGFYQEAWGGVTNVLNKEKIDQSKWPDPRNYQSFADLMDAVNEVVADARANKLAEKRAEAMKETIRQEVLSQVYAEYPKQPTLQGGAPVRPGEVPQNLKPMDLLRHALST